MVQATSLIQKQYQHVYSDFVSVFHRRKFPVFFYCLFLFVLTAIPCEAQYLNASGGTINTFTGDGTNGVLGVHYRVHTFTDTGTTQFIVNTPGANGQVEYLIVAAGGGGGIGNYRGGGGGGGGGFLSGTTTLTAQSYSIQVGAGLPNSNGGNSSFNSMIAIGGGRGGNWFGAGADGGSGGGDGGQGGAFPGLGTTGQGHDGGIGSTASLFDPGGGGGGAGSLGGSSPAFEAGGSGGDGLPSLISGSLHYYAGGGGGGGYAGTGPGGMGGGGNGGDLATDGVPNTGGGGGGGQFTMGSSGGSGIVIIRYPMASFATPVVISDWNAQCVENETVLHWTTTSEKNAAYFIIEKSLDAVQWYYLATMKAQGNSSVEQHYSYHDKKSQSGPRYYRLKQTDLDEQSVYSNVVHATCDGANDANIQIVPNPTQGLFHILNTNARSGTRISVYQSTGLKMATVNGGEKNVVIDLHKEPKGLYFIEIIQDQERYWKKVLLE